jgi:hypothetical protein
MNLDKIRRALEEPAPDNVIEQMIIQILADDEDVALTITNIVAQQRNNQKELITDMNAELSRAEVYISINVKEKLVGNADKAFILGEIAKFYYKYKGKIQSTFNR